jgi:large subunit ribosomal protein L23
MANVIKRPVITEKASKLNFLRQYVFEVEVNSNKIQIKDAIESMFSVNVVDLRTVRVKGKTKSRFTKKGLMRGKSALRKKAYITLKEGQTLDIVSGEATSTED